MLESAEKNIVPMQHVKGWASGKVPTWVKEAARDRFACGVLLHDGERIQRTAPEMFAMPIKMLWDA